MMLGLNKRWNIVLFLLSLLSILLGSTGLPVIATLEQHPRVFCPRTSLQSGDQLANELLNKIPHDKQQAGVHPFYQGISSEAGLSDVEVKGRVESVSHNNPVAQMVLTTSQTRPHFKIDPEKDPLLTGAQKTMSSALTVIGGEGTHLVQTTQGETDETLDCEEPGEDSLETCTNTLIVKIKRTKILKDWQGDFFFGKCINSHYQSCGGLRHVVFAAMPRFGRRHRPPDPNRLIITDAYKACQAELARGGSLGCWCGTSLPALSIRPDQISRVSLLPHPAYPHNILIAAQNCNSYKKNRCDWYYRPVIKITYEEEVIEVLPDEWESHCHGLEERSDQGFCTYGEKECTQGKQTRIIEGIPVTKDCWEETYTYSCSYPSENTCGPLRVRGCVQINSACKQTVGNKCVVYTQTYQCKGNKTTRETIAGGATPFCLDGSCRDQGFEANDEMMASIAQLSILKDLQGQPWNGTLFNGADNRCSKSTLSFKDCCGSGRGWGVSLGLAGCSADENALQIKRQKSLCHFVGTYCSKREKLTKICLQKKSTYCCFGSKLFKAFHEQGRFQIGMGWGSAEAPLCRGFTVNEIQRIDFSKLDLREAFEDLMQNFKPGKIQDINQKINERLQIMQQGVRPKTEPQMRQRDGA